MFGWISHEIGLLHKFLFKENILFILLLNIYDITVFLRDLRIQIFIKEDRRIITSVIVQGFTSIQSK